MYQGRWCTGLSAKTDRLCLVATASLGLVACDGLEVPPETVPEVAVAPQVSIRPEVSHGGEPFGRIADIEIGEDGALYVLDALSRAVRVFDGAGNEIDSFGQRGEGPGEFERPDQLVWGPEGRLWVFDPGLGRLTSFTAQGELVETARPVEMPLVFAFAMGFSGDTLRWVGVTSPDLANPAAGRVETQVMDGEVRPLGSAVLSFVEWPVLFEHRANNMVFALPVPFSGEPKYAFDTDGHLWYAHTRSPFLHRISEAGELESTIEAEVQAHPVTQADREEALSSAALEEVRAVGASALREISELIPNVRPALEGFFFGEDGQVWVVRSEPREVSEGRSIDIYDGEGTRLGRTSVRLDVEPRPRIRNGVLAAVTRDALGVESVVTYSIGTVR